MTGNRSGLVNLYKDMEACAGYNDIQVMWEMIHSNVNETKCKKRPFCWRSHNKIVQTSPIRLWHFSIRYTLTSSNWFDFLYPYLRSMEEYVIPRKHERIKILDLELCPLFHHHALMSGAAPYWRLWGLFS